MTGCGDLRHDLGGYVLSGLEDHERDALEAHLAACLPCRRELEEIAGLPALLDLVAEATPRPPPQLRDRVLAQAVTSRARRRWLAAAAAVLVAVAILGGAVGAWIVTAPGGTTLALEAVEPFEAGGRLVVREEAGRAVVDVEVHGLRRLPEGHAYEVWLSRAEGGLVSLGYLRPDAAGTARDSFTAEEGIRGYSSFWVTAEPDTTSSHEGPTVVEADLPQAR